MVRFCFWLVHIKCRCSYAYIHIFSLCLCEHPSWVHMMLPHTCTALRAQRGRVWLLRCFVCKTLTYDSWGPAAPTRPLLCMLHALPWRQSRRTYERGQRKTNNKTHMSPSRLARHALAEEGLRTRCWPILCICHSWIRPCSQTIRQESAMDEKKQLSPHACALELWIFASASPTCKRILICAFYEPLCLSWAIKLYSLG